MENRLRNVTAHLASYLSTLLLSGLTTMRRASSSRIKAQASPYHTSVTLFKTEDDAGPGSSTPRRPKRVKKDDDTSAPIVDVEDVITEAKPTPNGDMKPTKSPRKPKPIQQTLKTPHPSPPNWKETYDTIKEMRTKFIAPVDTMGCDQAQLKEKNPKVK